MKYKLKLKKALSYTGIISATKKNPYVFVDDKAVAEKAVSTGYFELIENIAESTEDISDTKGKKLEEMNVSELETFAAYKNISLKGISKKADIINKLKEELAENELAEEIIYGSPTMAELQEN